MSHRMVSSFCCEVCGEIHATEGPLAVFTNPTCRDMGELENRRCIDRQVKALWGERGIAALECSCLTDQDYKHGFHHVCDRIAGALQELGEFPGNW